ncbi:MAG: glycosyltransferase family 61 protein [Flammeovirgaceae bacterium]|nr:glycosyltransferase family 61 protein [Flammeovirgaceae bacterium]
MKQLKKKITNRLKLMAERAIPHNIQYQPNGVHPDAVSDADVQYTQVYSNYHNPLKITDDLFDLLSDYDKPDYKSVDIDYYIAEIPNGRVFFGNVATVAIISQSNKLVGDMSFSYADGDVVEAEKNNIFHQKYFNDPEEYDGTVFSLLTGGGGGKNYAHWLIDSLSRIHLLQKSGKFDEVDYFLVPSIRYDFQEDALKELGITRDKIIEADKISPHIKAKKLIASTAPRHKYVIIPEWVGDFYKDNFLKPENLKDFDSPNVYVSRADSGIRNVLNEPELMEMLEGYGFKSFELSKLNFKEKISLFAKAKTVLSVHGAGLTNVMFCEKGTKFIELYPDVFVLTTYVDLATKAGLDYSYMICKSSAFADNGNDAQKVHVTVDLPELKKMLEAQL